MPQGQGGEGKRARPWYLELLIDFPMVLPEILDLLSNPVSNPYPLVVAGKKE